MNAYELKNSVDLLPHIKSLIDGDGLIVSIRDIYVTKNFQCHSSSYVLVTFNESGVDDVITYPRDMSCPVWAAVDREINIGLIQGILRN